MRVIYNEKQETMFDTELSQATDNFMDLHAQMKRIKEVLPAAEAVLLEQMKKNDVGHLHIKDGPTLQMDVEESKTKIKILKPKKLSTKDERQKSFA